MHYIERLEKTQSFAARGMDYSMVCSPKFKKMGLIYSLEPLSSHFLLFPCVPCRCSLLIRCYVRGLCITGTILSGLLLTPGKESLRRWPPFSPPLNVPSEICSGVTINIQNMSCHCRLTCSFHYCFVCLFSC